MFLFQGGPSGYMLSLRTFSNSVKTFQECQFSVGSVRSRRALNPLMPVSPFIWEFQQLHLEKTPGKQIF